MNHPFVVSLSNHESPVRGELVEPQTPFDKLRANGFIVQTVLNFPIRGEPNPFVVSLSNHEDLTQ